MHTFLLTEKLQLRTFLNNREFLRSVVVGFHQNNARLHSAARKGETFN